MNDKFEQAIRLIQSGNKDGGRALLIEVLKADPKNDHAWIWMSTVVDTEELRQECLQEALKFNPNNHAAQRALTESLRPQLQSSLSSTNPTARPQQTFVVRPVIASLVGLFVLSLLFLAQIPALRAALGVLAISDSNHLQVVMAEVTEYRTGLLKGKTTYELRYRFLTPGNDQWFTASDPLFGQSDTWSMMTLEAWEQAQQRSNQIEVLYLPENPWLNRPAGELPANPVGTLAIWGWVTVLNLIALWEIFVARRNYLHCKGAIQDGQICQTRYWQVKQV